MKSRSLLKKIFFSLALAVGLAVGSAAVCSFADTATVNGIKYEYTYNSGIASVASNNNVSGNITIPSTITIDGNNYTVTSIGDSAFYGCSGLTSITIPEGVTTIDQSAFKSCSGLTTITIPSSLTTIGDFAFQNCSNLTSVTITDTQNNPSHLKMIGYWAFFGCTNLQNINIPSSVKTIDESPFSDCNQLNYNTYDNGKYLGNTDNPYYALIVATDKNITSCEIKDGTKVIAGAAFNNCKNLTSITIPSGVTSIGAQTFSYCTALTSVTIPSSVTEIGKSQFVGCTSLQSITIPSGIESISVAMFQGCSSLTSITIPSNITSIGAVAFYQCSSLENVFAKSGLDLSSARIRNEANIWRYEELADQTGAPQGKTLVKITGKDQGSDTSVACGAMGENYVIRSVSASDVSLTHSCNNVGNTFDFTDENNITWTCKILAVANGNTAGEVSIEPKDKNSLSGLDVVIPSTVTNGCFNYTVTEIANNAFENAVLKGVTIPSSVRSIGEQAFRYCLSITSIIFEGSSDDTSQLTTIGYAAFSWCIRLTSITIPSSVNSIGTYLFNYCNNLTNVTLPSGITSISSNMFNNCSNLTSITIPSNINSVGISAFMKCTSLSNVTISEGVKTIDQYAFSYCSFTNITIPSSVETIGNNAFYNCNNLADVFVETGCSVVSGAGIQNSANLWRYKVLADQTQEGKILVEITSVTKPDGSASSANEIRCDEMGNNYVIMLVSSSVSLKHVLPLETHAAVAATCTTAGNIGYWSCSECGKYFSDANGQNETTEIIIEALGHDLTEHQAQAATCSATGNVHYWSCGRSACLKNFSDAQATTEISDVTTAIDPDAHKWGTPGYTWQTQFGNTLNGSVNYECTYNHGHTKADLAVLTVYSGTYDGQEHTGVTISSNTTGKTIEFSKDGTNWSNSISYTNAGIYQLYVRFNGQTSNYGTATVTISQIDISNATLTISFNDIVLPNIPVYNGLVQVPDNISFTLNGNVYVVKGSA